MCVGFLYSAHLFNIASRNRQERYTGARQNNDIVTGTTKFYLMRARLCKFIKINYLTALSISGKTRRKSLTRKPTRCYPEAPDWHPRRVLIYCQLFGNSEILAIDRCLYYTLVGNRNLPTVNYGEAKTILPHKA